MSRVRAPLQSLEELQSTLKQLRDSLNTLSQEEVLGQLTYLVNEALRIFTMLVEQNEKAGIDSEQFKKLSEAKAKFDQELESLARQIKEIHKRTEDLSTPSFRFAFIKPTPQRFLSKQNLTVAAGIIGMLSGFIANYYNNTNYEYKIALLSLLYFSAVFRKNVGNQMHRLFNNVKSSQTINSPSINPIQPANR